jgi:hypothetical protein
MPPFPFKSFFIKFIFIKKISEKIKPMPPSTLQVNYSPLERIKEKIKNFAQLCFSSITFSQNLTTP